MVRLNNTTINPEYFPNGETLLELKKTTLLKDENYIELNFESDMDLMLLKYVVDFLRNSNRSSRSVVRLTSKYFPYSRMDNEENMNLLKSVAEFINSLKFDSVEIWEPHSEVCVALLDKVKVKWISSKIAIQAIMDTLSLKGSSWYSSHKEYRSNYDDYTYEGLVRRAKEAGLWLFYQTGKILKRYINQIEYDNIITYTKQLEFKTNKLEGVFINYPKDNNLKKAIIVHDICDKGDTFVNIASQLREKGFNDIRLVVTHCEESIYDGNIFNSHLFNKLYFTNSIINLEATDEYHKSNIEGTETKVYGSI